VVRLVVPLVLLLIAVGVLLLGRARGPGGAAASPREEPARAAATAPEILRADAAPARRSLETERAPSPTARPARGTRELWLEIVEVGTERPIAGADVWFRSHVGDENERRLKRGEVEFEDIAERATSDAAGRVRIEAVVSRELSVEARKGAWIGAVELEEVPGPEEDIPVPWAHVRLEDMSRDFHVEVLVLEVEGGPAAGVPLALRFEGSECREAVSGSDGIAVFEHVGILCADQLEMECWIQAEIATLEPVRTPVTELPALEIPVIRLPPTGSVRVALREADGSVVEERSRVTLVFSDATGRERSLVAWAEGGIARFPHVQIGLDLVTRAGRGHRQASVEQAFAGPLVRGQETACDLVLGLEKPVLRIRVVDAKRGPLADESIDFEVASASWKSKSHAQTDSEGVLHVDVQAAPEDEHLRVVIGRVSKSGRLDYDLPLTPGLQPTRDLVLEPAPVLFAGTLLDAEGRPFVTSDERYVEMHYSPVAAGGWHVQSSIHTDTEGRFELRRGCAVDELWVSAKRWNAESERQRVAVGATDVVLRLGEERD
jgi:hypothetical protein